MVRYRRHEQVEVKCREGEDEPCGAVTATVVEDVETEAEPTFRCPECDRSQVAETDLS